MNENSNPRPHTPGPNLRRAAFTFTGLGILLFLAAGTMRWAGAWVLLFEITIGGLITEAWLAKHDPGLLAERRTSRGQAGWDRIITTIMPLLWLTWLPLMALDAARYQTSLVPGWLQCAGAVMIAASFYIVYRTYRENSYAAPVVKIQRERGHAAVTTGPYAYVRHPIYASGLLTYVGAPLLLGSWYGLAIVPVMAALLGLRALMEERMLTAELDGYAEYLARVRYRLVPMVW
ncbi:methyltransferase family protein [Bradyrhizobium septentrionale]|uniref:Isoprenylcysteine carboxylmethyltransferase family protein n=1 Tax=Bradyrhizobium septentrionale TaxID=1404411 RepID=A0A974A5X2_9BRAD|nr:isoprenylcysteine carboxylmethyltransferase family protein [Bradyrhizobium septentrionale]UGY18319.1 isoprenylcysteine carboxylmethyltransferase family protein [Bradyrhizobium septentrionale]UGY27016.1 isoprenylcysteine carboxylmethyltransferase family protein [Bradyrhizobium septentrionale]